MSASLGDGTSERTEARMADKRVLILGFILLVMCCLVAAGCGSKETAAPAAPDAPAEPVPFVEMGPEDAVVTLVAYYPQDESHKFIVDHLKELAEAHPDSVSLVVFDQFRPENFDAWQQTGLGCAGVMVNGTTEWEVETDGTTEKVSFTKRMGVLWTQEQFDQVVNKLLAEAGAAEPAAG